MRKFIALLPVLATLVVAGCSSNSSNNNIRSEDLFSDRKSDAPLGLLEGACKLSPYASPLPTGQVMATTTVRFKVPMPTKVEDFPKAVKETRTVGASLGHRSMPDQDLHLPATKDCYGSVIEVTVGLAGADQRFPIAIAYDYKASDGMTKSFKGTVTGRPGEEVVVTRWGDVTMTITLGE